MLCFEWNLHKVPIIWVFFFFFFSVGRGLAYFLPHRSADLGKVSSSSHFILGHWCRIQLKLFFPLFYSLLLFCLKDSQRNQVIMEHGSCCMSALDIFLKSLLSESGVVTINSVICVRNGTLCHAGLGKQSIMLVWVNKKEAALDYYYYYYFGEQYLSPSNKQKSMMVMSEPVVIDD